MRKPIQKGDLCEVVAGLGREKSPNIGLRVKVVALQGEHSRHGRVWLRKIEPPPAPPKQAESKKEVVA